MTPASRTLLPAASPDTPEAALGEVWSALDALPAAGGTPSMTATTLEMVAVSAAEPPAAVQLDVGRWRVRTSLVHWAVPAIAVIVGLFFGIWLGRVTAPPLEPQQDDRLDRLERLQRLEREMLERRQKFNRPQRGPPGPWEGESPPLPGAGPPFSRGGPRPGPEPPPAPPFPGGTRGPPR